MAMKLTRRQLAATMAASAAGVNSSQAQQTSPSDQLVEAREEIRKAIEKMEEIDLPVSAQPAFRFEPF